MRVILTCLAFAIVHVDAALVAPRAPGASMLSAKQVSHITPPKGTPTVEHTKEKNGGYVRGSPLYNKQEGIRDEDKHPTKAHSALDKAVADQKATLDNTQAPTSVSDALGLVWKTHLFFSLGTVSVYAVAVLICAYFYWKREAGLEALGAKSAGRTASKLPLWTNCGFAHSFCDCGNLGADWPICLTAWCCPIISWADTASRSVKPFMSYWKAIALFLAMVVLSPFTLGLSGLLMGIALFIRRGSLRKAYGHTEGKTKSVLGDLCVVFCCSQFLCCQLVQEAREIEYNSPPDTATAYPSSVPASAYPSAKAAGAPRRVSF